MQLHRDEDLAAAFLKSPTWRRHRRFQPFKHKNGTRDLVRSFIRTYENIPFDADTPEEVELATGRVTRLVQSEWAKTAAKTRKENWHALITYRAERSHKKYLQKKKSEEAPSFFEEGLLTIKKPPRKVA
ncbi:MAG: hypothetical protein AAB927_00785 [Patescibacteria group bacterium]